MVGVTAVHNVLLRIDIICMPQGPWKIKETSAWCRQSKVGSNEANSRNIGKYIRKWLSSFEGSLRPVFGFCHDRNPSQSLLGVLCIDAGHNQLGA